MSKNRKNGVRVRLRRKSPKFTTQPGVKNSIRFGTIIMLALVLLPPIAGFEKIELLTLLSNALWYLLLLWKDR